MNIKFTLIGLLLLIANSAQALPQKWQITLDLTMGQVSLIETNVVDGYPKPQSNDHTNLYYEVQGMTKQAQMLTYRVLDNQLQLLEVGRFSDTEVISKCAEHIHNKEPMRGELTIKEFDIYLLEIPFNQSARWLEVTRGSAIFSIDLYSPPLYASSRVTSPPVVIGSPQLIINNGPSSQKIDLVIIGDGWGDLPGSHPDSIVNYRALVNQVAPLIFQGGWHSGHANKFNVWRIDVDGSFGASPASMWPSLINDLYRIAGLVPFDQIMLVVKDSGITRPRARANDTDLFTMWDGAPDFYPIIADVTRHELGHTLGQMADEYGPFGSPVLVYFPAAPIRAAGNDVIWDNLTVWGRVGDLQTLQQKRPFWGTLLGTHAVLDRQIQQQYLHHWFWDVGTFEGGALADFDIWHSNPLGAMCCGGAPWNSVPYDVMTKHTTRFVPLDPPLNGSVTLISPSQAATLSGERMVFRWQAVPGATDYHLVVRRVFTGETFFSIPTKNTELEIYTAGLVPGEPHSWTVIAANNRNETLATTWRVFGFSPNQPYATQCGDVDRDGILTLDDVNVLSAILYEGAWVDEYVCIAGDVDSDARILHTESFPYDFGDMEIIRYWALCNPVQNPQGCGTAPGHLPGQIPPLPTCTTLPGTFIANCTGRTFRCGDYNNDNYVTVIDSLGIAQNSAALTFINPTDPLAFQKCGASDPSGNRQIDILDALLVAQDAVGLGTPLSCPPLIPDVGGLLPAWCSR